MEFVGFADVKEFQKISGLSKNDLEKHVFPNKEFQNECMYRFGKNYKRYIEVEPAIRFIKTRILVKENDLERW